MFTYSFLISVFSANPKWTMCTTCWSDDSLKAVKHQAALQQKACQDEVPLPHWRYMHGHVDHALLRFPEPGCKPKRTNATLRDWNSDGICNFLLVDCWFITYEKSMIQHEYFNIFKSHVPCCAPCRPTSRTRLCPWPTAARWWRAARPAWCGRHGPWGAWLDKSMLKSMLKSTL